MNKLTKDLIEEFEIGETEARELEGLPKNQFDFVMGMKRLMKDTGVTVIAKDFGTAVLSEKDCKDDTRLHPFGVITPRKGMFRTKLLRGDYKL